MTPPTIDPRLINMLKKSKEFLEVSESKIPLKKNSTVVTEALANTSSDPNYQPTNNYQRAESTPIYSEYDEKEMLYSTPTPQRRNNDVYDYSEEQLNASKMPSEIKEIMAKHKLPKHASPTSMYSTEQLVEAMGGPKKQVVTETQKKPQGDMITISKTQLNELVSNMVDKKLLEYFTKSYNKIITQETVKSTINTLIREGKIETKKKPV